LIIADTSGLLAAFGQDAREHRAARTAVEADDGPIVVSPFVLAELDYLLMRRAGVVPELRFLREVAAGVFELASFGRAELAQAASLIERYQDMRIGLADASLVVLAARYGTTRLLTLDERHFRAIRPLHGDAFTILPADS
jgi:predicted nucleic acid-binding protein